MRFASSKATCSYCTDCHSQGSACGLGLQVASEKMRVHWVPAGSVWDSGRGGEPSIPHRCHAVYGLEG